LSGMEGVLFRHLGRTLVLVRQLRGGMRQAECARRAGMPRAQLSRYETDGAAPTLESLAKILGALHMGPDEFFAALAAVDLLEGGEEPLESIRSRVLERLQGTLDELLAGVARLREAQPAREEAPESQ
jgi:transcriptional regulator with XRE-family HTH domain